jgi:hypothetical protein
LAVTDNDEQQRDVGARLRGLSTLQQRFEASAAGRAVISGVVLVIVLIGAVWNLPDSPIKRMLSPVAKPVAVATGLDQGWAMYAPNPSRRVDTVEVQVAMADGENRIWTMQPGARGISEFGWDRWMVMRYSAVLDANVRPDLARWVARQVTGPGERAVSVTVILRTQTLQSPDEPAAEGSRANATKVLYQENLAAQQ